MVQINNESDLFATVCMITANLQQVCLAWIGQPEASSQNIVSVAVAGDAREFVKQFIVSMDPASPEGQGPTWLAYHENRMVSVNDFQADPMTVPWHNNHESAFGWGSLLCHSHFI